MLDYQLLTHSLVVAVVVFALGVVGFVARRNFAIVMISATIMLQGVMLAVDSFSTFHGSESGETLSAFVALMTVMLALLTVSMMIAIARSRGSFDVSRWRALTAAANDETAPVDPGLSGQKHLKSHSDVSDEARIMMAATDATRGAGD